MLKISHLPENIRGRDLVCGDLHGCVDLLMRALSALNFNPSVDRVFCVGDLCGRGPKSLDSVYLLAQPWFYSVRGNHEVIIELFACGAYNKNYLKECGESWFEDQPAPTKEDIVAKIEALPDALLVGFEGGDGFNVFHAEFQGTQAELEQGKVMFTREGMEEIHWGRGLINHYKHHIKHGSGPYTPSHFWEKVALARSFVGHSIVEQPLRFGNVIYLDTGAFRAFRREANQGFLTVMDAKTLMGVCSGLEGVHPVQIKDIDMSLA